MLIEEFHEIQAINDAIKVALEQLLNQNADSEEYSKIADQLTKLMKVKEIAATVCLKNHDSLNKKSELEIANNQKAAELAQRKQEFEKTTSSRTSELNRRTIEFESTTSLREVELN